MRLSSVPNRLSLLLIAGVIAATGPLLAGQLGQPIATQAPVPAAAAPTALLAGQVVEQGTGRGIAGASVLILQTGRSVQPPTGARGDLNFASMISTDSQGRFVFAPLAAGSYALQVTKPDYALNSTTFFRAIDLTDGERVTDLKVRLQKFATLAGTIRDEGGDPIVGTEVLAFRRSLVNGQRSLGYPMPARSDDRGAYRISGLMPGEYVVCACRRDPIPFDGVLLTTLAADPMNLMGIAARALTVGADAASLDSTLRTYPPTFHPSSATVARATSITLGSGEEKSGIDVNVASVVATRLSGSIIGAIGPLHASSLRLAPAGESDEAAALAVWTPALVQPTGRFDFAGVPPGQYVLRIVHGPTDPAGTGAPSGAALQFIGARGSALAQPMGVRLANESPQWAAEPIVVGPDGASGIAVALRRAPALSGRVEVLEAAVRPAVRAPVVVLLPAGRDLFGRAGTPSGTARPDGTFRIPGVLPGRYVVSSSIAAGHAALKSVVVAGVDLTDLPLQVDAADINDVVVTLTDAPMATLSGIARDGGGAPADSATVIAFPADRKYWAEISAARRLFRTAPVTRKGVFTIASLPAGEYFVVVVSDEDASEWQETSRLEVLSRSAQRVQVRDGDKIALEIRR